MIQRRSTGLSSNPPKQCGAAFSSNFSKKKKPALTHVCAEGGVRGVEGRERVLVRWVISPAPTACELMGIFLHSRHWSSSGDVTGGLSRSGLGIEFLLLRFAKVDVWQEARETSHERMADLNLHGDNGVKLPQPQRSCTQSWRAW